HLHVVGHEAGIHRGAGGTHGGAELVGDAVEHLEVVAVLHAATTGDNDLGGGQFRAVGLRQLLALEGGQAAVVDGGHRLDGGGTTAGGGCLEGGTAHGEGLDGITALHGGDHIAGIDRALEGVGRHHGADLGNGLHVEERGGAGQHVLAGGGGGGEDMAVILAELGDQRGDIFRQLVTVGGVVRHQHLADAGDLGGGLGGGAAILAGHQDVDVTADGLGRGNGVEGSGVKCVVAVLSNHQNAHQITFASFFSLSTSCATSATLMPALRSAGGSTLSSLVRGATSTPRSAGVTVSSCFFLAFMMLGREA